MAKIEFDYAQATQQAKELDELSDELSRFANQRYSQAMEESAAAWRGSTADLFLVKCGKTKMDLLQRAEQLQSAANKLRKIAKTMRDAENRVIQRPRPHHQG